MFLNSYGNTHLDIPFRLYSSTQPPSLTKVRLINNLFPYFKLLKRIPSFHPSNKKFPMGLLKENKIKFALHIT